MSGAPKRPSSTHSFLHLMALCAVTTVIIGSLLYYAQRRQEVLHVQAVEQMTLEAHKQQALAASHVLGTLSRHVIQDVARLQELVNTGLESEGLQDFLVISRDNVVLAATNAGQVGQQLRDATWLAWKGQRREVAQRAVNQAGQPVWVIVEPLKDRGDVLAWAMLVFALPEQSGSLPSTTDRLMDIGRLLVPIFVVLLLSCGLAMKLATAAIRRQIRGLMASVLEEPSEPGETAWLRKVS